MDILKSILIIVIIAPALAVFSQNPPSPYQVIRLNDGNPIITSDIFLNHPEGGEIINGPSMIRIPDWIMPEDRADPSAQYYLYFGHHQGDYIRMAWAENIEGPYILYDDFSRAGDRGVLDNRGTENGVPTDGYIFLDNDISIRRNHLSSPDVIVDDVNQRIIMYFHSGAVTFVDNERIQAQLSWVSTSPYGLEFYDNIEPVYLGPFYFRVFEYNNLLYSLSNGAQFNRARSKTDPWTPPADHNFINQLWDTRNSTHLFNDAIEESSDDLIIRHTGVHLSGNELQVFYSRTGEFQERIQLSTVNLTDSTPLDWEDWEVLPTNTEGFLAPIEILTPNPGWEGGELLMNNSERGDAVDVNQLRDPDIFEDTDGQLYLLYSGKGEVSLGIARLDDTPETNATLTATEDTFVRDGNSSNFGSLNNLRVSSGTDADDKRTIYMKFDLTSITQLDNAIVRLFANTVEIGGAPVTIYETSNNWDESTLTSNNAPALGKVITTSYISNELEFYDWNITEYAQTHLGQELSVAFDIAPSNNVQHHFSSIEDGTPGQLLLVASPVIATWNGADWSPRIPTPEDTAVLAADYHTAIDGNLEVNALEVQDGATLTVADNTFVQTQGAITVNQNGTIDIANAGSIVQTGTSAATINNGIIMVNKTTPDLNPSNFIVLSSPMSAETNGGAWGDSSRVFSIIPENFTPNTNEHLEGVVGNFIDNNGDYLDDLERNDLNLLGDATGLDNILNPAQGYIVFPQDSNDANSTVFDHTYTQGTLNGGDITIPIHYNGPTSENNFNLLGNPYPSAIDIDLLITDNSAINEVYFWGHTTTPNEINLEFDPQDFSMDDVSVRNVMMGIAALNGGTTPSKYMSSGQGFGILADQEAAGINVTFTNAMRIANNNSTVRSAELENKLWLRLDSETYTMQSIMGLGFVPEATPAIDPGYDSKRLATTISLFSTSAEAGEQLSIQGRELFDPTMHINLGFQSLISQSEKYTISIDRMEGIGLDQNSILLIDNVLGIVTNLKETAYDFVSSEALQEDRFTLTFNSTVLNTQENSLDNNISIYPNPAQGQIQLTYTGSHLLNNLIITDTLGKRVFEVALNQFNGTQNIDVSKLQVGMYFFTIVGNQNTITKKVLIK